MICMRYRNLLSYEVTCGRLPCGEDEPLYTRQCRTYRHTDAHIKVGDWYFIGWPPRTIVRAYCIRIAYTSNTWSIIKFYLLTYLSSLHGYWILDTAGWLETGECSTDENRNVHCYGSPYSSCMRLQGPVTQSIIENDYRIDTFFTVTILKVKYSGTPVKTMSHYVLEAWPTRWRLIARRYIPV